jgi:subtilase family protein
MRAARWLHFRHGLGAIAAALIAASISFGVIGSSQAESQPPQKRVQKKAPPKPAARAQPRGTVKGPNAPRPNAVGPGPRPEMSRGPKALPQNVRTQPNGAGPNFRGPGVAARDPRRPNLNGGPGLQRGPGPNGPNMRSTNVGPANARFSRPVSRPSVQAGRGLGLPGSRGYINRSPQMRAVNAATPQLRQLQRATHRNEMLAIRSRLPTYPLPGERNFTGVPPVSETRFVQTEMVCQWGPDMTQAGIEAIARRHNLEIASVQRSALTGGTLVHFRIAGGRAPRDVVRAMESEQIISQPNYVYEEAQSQEPAQEPASASSAASNDQQYAANMLKLAEVHKIATGKGVLVAVIDSQIDSAHPELQKGIAESFDAVGRADQPHTHGTGMAGAIVSQDRLMGVAPGVRTLAIHAFATGTQQSPQATTQSIIAGLEWALNKGARVVNMSFAGPYDPILALAIKKASERGAILIAAVGNAGPKSPPLFPGADPHVIGVSAVDENDRPYSGANIGPQVAVAAPGVDVMVPAPAGAYQLTTGTSVAAAHVSGVAALLLEKHPDVDAQLVLEVLTASATRQNVNKRDDKMGWGLIDPLAALAELDLRLAEAKVAGAPPAAPTPTATQAASSAPTVPPAPASAATRSALPRPGVFPPKQ